MGPMDNKKVFPLSVTPAPSQDQGWYVVITLENGERNRLLKPGWSDDDTHPYVFASEQEAWDFIRQLFYFCIKQAHMQFLTTDKILNCKQCGRIIRAKYFEYCATCMQGNEFMLQQIWQGFYYMTGSAEGALQKITLLLKLTREEFSQVPEAFQTIVQRQLELHDELERKTRSVTKTLAKKIQAQAGFHHYTHTKH
jgi:hypothetical protein